MKIDEKRTNGLVGNITNDCNDNKCVWGNEEISNESHKTDEDSGKTNENIGKGRDRGTCTEKHNNALNVTPFASMIKSSIEQSLK